MSGRTAEREERLDALLPRYRTAGQAHVFRFWDELSDEERDGLLVQAASIDLDLVRRLHEGDGVFTAPEGAARARADVHRLGESVDGVDPAAARERGEALLREGKVAAFLVAGGQGSRLGFPGPKGCFSIGPLSGRTLFEIHALKIRRTRETHGASLPWYIMTSQQNDAETRAFFAEHDHFGLPPDDVRFIPQAMLPAVDAEGRLLLETKSRIFEAPNGHGGAYGAFASGALDHAVAHGVEQVYYFQVDNPLADIADPTFIGFHDALRADMSLKVLEKTGPGEKLGVVVLEGGKPSIVEYSDLSPEEASLRDADGRLVYWAGSIAIHCFRVDFMRRVASGELRLPYHVATKNIATLDDEGLQASVPGRKFETFVFDALPLASRYFAVETSRASEFAPVKNREGVDSIATAQSGMTDEHRRWLARVGVEARGRVEISPLVAVRAEDLDDSLADVRGQCFEDDVRIERRPDGRVEVRPV